MNNNEFIELACERLNCTPYKIAKILNIRPDKIYSAKKGRQPLSDHAILQLAKLIKIDPAIPLTGTLAERTKDKEKRKIFERVSKALQQGSATLAVFAAPALLDQAQTALCILCKIDRSSARHTKTRYYPGLLQNSRINGHNEHLQQ